MTTPSILIIEDNAEIRDTLRDVFESEGYSVGAAENGQVGLGMARQLPAPGLILLDLMMPVMDGWQFLQALKDEGLSRIPVTVISGIADQEDIVADLKLRFGCDFITKPADIDRLLNAASRFCCSSGET